MSLLLSALHQTHLWVYVLKVFWRYFVDGICKLIFWLNKYSKLWLFVYFDEFKINTYTSFLSTTKCAPECERWFWRQCSTSWSCLSPSQSLPYLSHQTISSTIWWKPSSGNGTLEEVLVGGWRSVREFIMGVVGGWSHLFCGVYTIYSVEPTTKHVWMCDDWSSFTDPERNWLEWHLTVFYHADVKTWQRVLHTSTTLPSRNRHVCPCYTTINMAC